MPLDPSIPMSFRFPQIESPVQQYQSLLQLKGLMQQQEETKRKSAQEQEEHAQLRSVMQQTQGDPQKAITALLASGTPQSIALASKLKGLVAKPEDSLFAKPKIEDFTPESRARFMQTRNPADLVRMPQEPKQEANPEIVKLGNLLQTLPAGHPMRGPVEARIKMLTERAPGVTVNMPASSDLMQLPDGTFARVRIGKNGQVETIPLGNARPPLTPAERKAEGEQVEGQATVESVRARVAKMASLIQGGAMAGGVVGPLGIASRVGETVTGAVSNTPTPAIDFKNEQALLLADVRKMVEKDPNLSKDERERLYETLGGGIMQTPGSSIRTLNNVLSYVENKRVTGKSRAARVESKAPPTVGTVQQGYRFKGGDPAKQENWEKVN